jgi:class 3 adenylate cyclase/pimeloyl-ACP methyl ester carboxylesterase
VSEPPDTRYAKAATGGYVAYQVVGDGPVDVLVNHPPVFPIDLMWDEPRLAYFLNRLSSFARHIWFDVRGTGASDAIPHGEGRLLEHVVDDMVAVLDAVGCERVALLELGVPVGLWFTATHPERATALVLVNSTARLRRADDYPEGLSDDQIEAQIERGFDPNETLDGTSAIFASSLVDDRRFQHWLRRAARLTAPPEERRRRTRTIYDIDLRDVLSAVRAPTLVIGRRERRSGDQTRYLADHIDGATLAEVPGSDVFPFVGDADAVLDSIEEFLTGKLSPPAADRVLATVLFTDVVNSTSQAERMGDRRWRELLATHDAVVRAELEQHRGREIKSTGDGVLAIFDGPGRAIRCACAIRDAIRALGLEIRAGLHTGEIELRGDDIGGIAVHIGQRVAAHAAPSEVLVSRTVADLVAGSQIELLDRGDHTLKGVSGTWRLFSVRSE